MRIATTLMLGAALLAGAGAHAQQFAALPAVPPKSTTRTATTQPAAPTGAIAPAISTKAPAATPAAAKPDAAKTEGEPLQEAKNNDAGVIDAGADAGNDTDSIVATVNDESISDFELRQRMALYLALQGGGVTLKQLTAEQ